MIPAPSPAARVLRFFARLVAIGLAAVFGLFGLLLMLGAATVGLVVWVVLYAWARLRGRPVAPWRVRWHSTWQRSGRWRTRAGTRRTERSAEVVDVDFTEVQAPPPQPPKRLE